MKTPLISAALALCLAAAAQAQTQDQVRADALDPSPIGSPTDPIDTSLWIGDYRNAKPRPQYGALQVRDILTDLNGADRLHPTRRGAVLETMHRISQASLAPGATAAGRAPQGDREVYYVAGGAGAITVNGHNRQPAATTATR